MTVLSGIKRRMGEAARREELERRPSRHGRALAGLSISRSDVLPGFFGVIIRRGRGGSGT
jgi:hypothetical protein